MRSGPPESLRRLGTSGATERYSNIGQYSYRSRRYHRYFDTHLTHAEEREGSSSSSSVETILASDLVSSVVPAVSSDAIVSALNVVVALESVTCQRV